MKKIYIAGKITGECEAPELMLKCKEKFYSYPNEFGYDIESVYKKANTSFYLHDSKIWYTNGLFINKDLIAKGIRDWSLFMKNDIAVMLTCDEVHFLPDWMDSNGARLEHHIAEKLGMKIVFVD